MGTCVSMDEESSGAPTSPPSTYACCSHGIKFDYFFEGAYFVLTQNFKKKCFLPSSPAKVVNRLRDCEDNASSVSTDWKWWLQPVWVVYSEKDYTLWNNFGRGIWIWTRLFRDSIQLLNENWYNGLMMALKQPLSFTECHINFVKL